ncbi:MAG: hypothetical protein IH586_00260 [Anaerolineaceae bacterium]|nr:hypothetical protein [Anaerolineaceae bacterium]
MKSNLIGIIMAPMTLLINITFLNQALFDSYGTLMLGILLGVFGLGFGLAWGQTAKLYKKGENVVVKRSVLHLVFWGVSYTITQLLATFASIVFVAGGLATMFFSAGSTVGTNTNMLVRQRKIKA